jgi:hypothetical protein
VPPRSRCRARASRICRHVRASQICCHRAPSRPPQPLSKPTAPRATTIDIRPGCAATARPLRGRRRRSILGECCRRWPAFGRHRRWPSGSPPLAPLSKPPSPLTRGNRHAPLKSYLWRPEDVFIAARTWCGWTGWHHWGRTSSIY